MKDHCLSRELVQPHFSRLFLKKLLCLVNTGYFTFHYEDNVASWKTIIYIVREKE